MKQVILTAGRVGGAADTVVFPSVALAVKGACLLVRVFSGDVDHPHGKPDSWWIGSRKSGRRTNRESWESPSGFYVVIEKKEV